MAVVNLNQFTQFVGYTRQRVSAWIRQGMPAKRGRKGRELQIDTVLAMKWLHDYWSAPTRGKPLGERERLAREQADRLAMQNEATRNQLVYADQVGSLVSAAVSELDNLLSDVPDRLAAPLANETNAALAREILLTEHRRIRAAYATALKDLADRIEAQDV